MPLTRTIRTLAAAATAAGLVLAALAAPSASAAASSGRCAPGTDTPPMPAPRQTLAEEFNGAGLDRSRWNTVMDFPGRNGGHQHNSAYLSYAQDDNIVFAGDGTLRLRAEKETVTGTDPVGTWQYSQGFMSSHDRFHQRYGYFEICAKYPAGTGLWPAFWLAPQDRTWPPEIDIAEWFGGFPRMFMGHASGPDYTDVTWHGQYVTGSAPTEGWHTYGVEWRANRIAYYIDGVKHHELTAGVPRKSMYIILNSGVAALAAHGGPPDASTVFPNDFQIDYLRVYA